ncbi:carbon-nitrogen hydrolase family protein [Amycolatopsis echigonensis]|uniref:Carbon-nitrogen hydrolase family protein n=1 Tax=Amycolatopsis echigonensis TaxID=2576905 RepID=A0A8E1VUS3_9PSEU|nr:carbon-nitrogen hydrolase family protein [Amycolatopsis echigonensis]MBB2498698.1 carbon-nitrogen hydrolase family protein [Amycolatopsis echigonensis]
MTHVALAQYAPGEDKAANRTLIAKLAGDAADRGARVIVLPEYAMFTVPEMDQRFVDSAESLDGPFVTGLLTLARDRGITIVGGMNERLDGSRISNTLVAAGPGGVTAVYRKIHLYDAFGFRESDVVRAGEIADPETFEVDGLRFGLQTCYDLRFPEVTRRLADAGADVVLLPAEWVPGPLKEYHWSTLVRARAIENTLYVAATGQAAPTGSGTSMLVDPMGVVVTSLGEQTGVAVGEVSRERIAEVRAKNPALELRRFSVVPR